MLICKAIKKWLFHSIA